MQRRSSLTIIAVLEAAVLTTLISPVAAQEPGKVRVVVEKFMGSKANRVRGYALSALDKRRDIELVPTREVVTALTRLGVTLDSENGYVQLSRELRVNAFLDGEVTRNEKGWTASLWVREGNGKFVGQYSWENKRFGRLSVIKGDLWDKLGEAILSAQVGQLEAEVPTQTEEREAWQQELTEQNQLQAEAGTEPESEGETPETQAAEQGQKQLPSALHARLVFGANWRNNSYEPGDAEQPYHYYNEFLKASAWLAIHAKWFPAAHFSDEWFAHLGLAGDFGIGLGAGSVYEDPESDEKSEPGTTSFAFSAGLLGRIPIDPVELGITVAYGQRVFKTSGFDGLPDVAHSFLRLGARGDISLIAGLGVDLGIAYLLRLDSGEIASDDYFPKFSGGGVEGGIGIYYKVIKWLSLRADWSVQYFYFDAGTSDAFEDVTGGDDAYYTATVGVAYELGGKQ